jgi:hypothetical protein
MGMVMARANSRHRRWAGAGGLGVGGLSPDTTSTSSTHLPIESALCRLASSVDSIPSEPSDPGASNMGESNGTASSASPAPFARCVDQSAQRGGHRRVISDPPTGLSALRTPEKGTGHVAFELPEGSSGSHKPLRSATRAGASRRRGGGHLPPALAPKGSFYEDGSLFDAEEVLSPLQVLAAEEDYRDSRRRIVRNRWQLYWLLYKNPILQGYRAHAIATMTARETELQQRANNAKRLPFWRWLPKKAKHAASEMRREVDREMTRHRARPPTQPAESIDEESSRANGFVDVIV